MTDYYQQALDRDHEGNPQAAAPLYALKSFETLVESNYELDRELRLGVTHMLQAVSADVRAGNFHRGEIHLQMVEPVFEYIASESNEQCIRGLAKEWLGDGYFMIGDDKALDQYSSVEKYMRI